ncbi:4Fe-4S domain-containing protein [Salidesulfovibrio brasiliensis]|uniref:4Fe-4S domain-containing protein n=1 Tax=Salidesulfovibrio brasiliensis TaxID=221711 RepID=UPI0006D1F23E|nr:ferredoxin [Salidesulfovibrio brasiliensis]
MSDSKKKEVGLDLSGCNGCYGCVDLNPEVFGWDDGTEKPFLVKPEATEEEIAEAAMCCPGDCIFLVDD